MARIAGVNIPQNKLVHIGLTYIYGIGLNHAKTILNKINVDINKKTNQLSEEEVLSIRNELSENYVVEGQLRSSVGRNIKNEVVKKRFLRAQEFIFGSQNKFWIPKILLWLIFNILPFFFSDSIINPYIHMARIGSGIFLLIQFLNSLPYPGG